MSGASALRRSRRAPPREDTAAVSAAAGGVFRRVGDFVVCWPMLVVGAWVALAAGLFVTLPPLAQMVREHPVALMPADTPAMVTAQQMAKAFHQSASNNLLIAVLTDEKGLRPADENVYRRLVGNLRQDTQDIVMLQDFLSTPALREAMTSKDHKAWLLPIGIPGEVDDAYSRVTDIVKRATAGTSLTANLTGPAATLHDLADLGDRDRHTIEIATAVMVLVILLTVYRNPLTMLLPLITIGISLVTARGIVAGLAQHGLPVSYMTVVFMTAMMAGAGTDYAVFLISRYHDHLRLGADSDRAIKQALTSVGKVITASAATVALTFLCMIFARLGVLSTVGPALAISIGVVLLAAVTLLPAIIVLTGRWGWIAPRRDLTTRFWRRSGRRIVRRPTVYLVTSLAILSFLAGCGNLVHYNWDQSKTLPDTVESNRGYAAVSRHFPLNATIPQYLLIQSPHDLRSPKALADLEHMAARVSQLPGIEAVRGITRPTGQPPEQASLAYQAGEVGNKLRDASNLINDHTSDLDLLANGAKDLARNLSDARSEVNQAGSQALGVINALSDPRIQDARALLERLAHDGMLDKITQLARQLPPTPETQIIESSVNGLRGTLTTAVNGLQSSALGNAGAARARLAALQQGTEALADGSARLADGVQQLVDQTKRIGAGLRDASGYLLALKRNASDPAMAGFYVPPQVLTGDDFTKAATVFVSPDGHAVRYLIQAKLDPFSTAAMDQVDAITDTARSAQPNTALLDASISMAGFPAANRDLRDYYNLDLRFIIMATVVIVFLILILLLRALIAPIYLICSVVLSYMAALGIGVIVFQLILGQALSWSVPGIAFIVLVAVGADYNMLLICGIRDESSQRGIPSGVIRTVASTGGVITSAGVIFAASMFGLLFGNIDGMVQAGFIIGAGLLLDTFLVRTVTVPALAVLVGRANWWPILWGRPCAREPIQLVEPKPKDQATMPAAAILSDPPALIPDIPHGSDSLSRNVGTQSGNKRHFHRRAGRSDSPMAQGHWVPPVADRTLATPANPQTPAISTSAQPQTVQAEPVQISAPVHPDPPQALQDSAQTQTTPVDADFVLELIDTGATTQSLETVIAVLAARLDGASISAAAKAAGINYRSAQRIVEAAAERRLLAEVS
jgi:putative drug exporter of the RND superfamily